MPVRGANSRKGTNGESAVGQPFNAEVSNSHVQQLCWSTTHSCESATQSVLGISKDVRARRARRRRRGTRGPNFDEKIQKILVVTLVKSCRCYARTLFFTLSSGLPHLTSKVTCFRGAPSAEQEEEVASRRRIDRGVVGLISEMTPAAASSWASADIGFLSQIVSKDCNPPLEGLTDILARGRGHRMVYYCIAAYLYPAVSVPLPRLPA